jgi:transposase
MSLPVFSAQQSLFGIGSLADNLFPTTNRYRLFAEKVWPLLAQARPTLETMYCAATGRPAAEPVVLAGVCLLQFLERVPDRAAMELLAMHLGWKRALHRDLDAGGHDPSLLTYFRQRLLDHEQGRLVFDTIVAGLVTAGLLPKRARQRLDSTHVLGVVRQMSALECVRETLRLTLETIAPTVAAAQRPAAWATWWERYVESKLDYRADAATLWTKLDQAGADAWALLEWVVELAVAVQAEPKVTLLAQVFDEYFERVEQQWRGRRAHVAGGIQNPHEPEAQWRSKGKNKNWLGYQVQVAETAASAPVAAGEPTRQFLTAVETQPATASDEAGLPQVLTAQAASGLECPSEVYADGAYISAGAMAEARAAGWELQGPAQPSAPSSPGYRAEAFTVNVAARTATCPAGQASTQCSRLHEAASGQVRYRFEWSWHCRDCPHRGVCVGKNQVHRTLVVGEHHDLLQARRHAMATSAFRELMKRRAAIEGTISELVRAHGLRRARYRGLRKVALQNWLTGAACNVKRWLRLLAWQTTQATTA